jgi:hypothetical protein
MAAQKKCGGMKAKNTIYQHYLKTEKPFEFLHELAPQIIKEKIQKEDMKTKKNDTKIPPASDFPQKNSKK